MSWKRDEGSYANVGTPCATCEDVIRWERDEDGDILFNEDGSQEAHICECWVGEAWNSGLIDRDAFDTEDAARDAAFSKLSTPEPFYSTTMQYDAWSLAEYTLGVDHEKVLLFGPPGTGKTTLAMTHALNGRNVHSVTMTEDMPAEALRGHFVSDGNGFSWMHGPGAVAWLNGDRLVVNEIDHATGDGLDMLHVLCDDPQVAAITLPNVERETIHPAPKFQCVATMNGTPSALPQALADRFPVALHIEEVRSAAIQSLPGDLHNVARESSKVTDPSRHIGMRRWMAFASLRSKLGAENAAMACFGPNARDILAQIEMSQR